MLTKNPIVTKDGMFLAYEHLNNLIKTQPLPEFKSQNTENKNVSDLCKCGKKMILHHGDIYMQNYLHSFDYYLCECGNNVEINHKISWG